MCLESNSETQLIILNYLIVVLLGFNMSLSIFFCYYNPALLSFFNLIISIGVLLSTRDTNVFVCSSHKEAEEWRTVFWVTFVIYVVGMLLFCLLMSADQQPWANGHEGKKNGEREEIKMEEES